MGMLSPEQLRAMDKASNPAKLLPTTIEFLKEMRRECNEGRQRRGEKQIPWTSADEARS